MTCHHTSSRSTRVYSSPGCPGCARNWGRSLCMILWKQMRRTASCSCWTSLAQMRRCWASFWTCPCQHIQQLVVLEWYSEEEACFLNGLRVFLLMGWDQDSSSATYPAGSGTPVPQVNCFRRCSLSNAGSPSEHFSCCVGPCHLSCISVHIPMEQEETEEALERPSASSQGCGHCGHSSVTLHYQERRMSTCPASLPPSKRPHYHQ